MKLWQWIVLVVGMLGCGSESVDAGDAGTEAETDTGTDGTDTGTAAAMDSATQTDSDSSVDSETAGDTGTDSGTDADVHIWQPAPGTTWQWQLSGTLDSSYDVEMYDIDLFDTPKETILALKDAGRKVVCYFSAGSYEDWREDTASWRPGTDDWIGSPLDGWDGEYWLDVSATKVRELMRARMDVAVEKGCDGVEPDNVDGYANANGLGLSGTQQLDFNRFLASEAHARGLSIGLKNDLDQVNQLVSDFDWALNEECFEWNECDVLSVFIDAGKAVFHTEYSGNMNTICTHPSTAGFSTIQKNYDLDEQVTFCP